MTKMKAKRFGCALHASGSFVKGKEERSDREKRDSQHSTQGRAGKNTPTDAHTLATTSLPVPWSHVGQVTCKARQLYRGTYLPDNIELNKELPVSFEAGQTKRGFFCSSFFLAESQSKHRTFRGQLLAINSFLIDSTSKYKVKLNKDLRASLSTFAFICAFITKLIGEQLGVRLYRLVIKHPISTMFSLRLTQKNVSPHPTDL